MFAIWRVHTGKPDKIHLSTRSCTCQVTKARLACGLQHACYIIHCIAGHWWPRRATL